MTYFMARKLLIYYKYNSKSISSLFQVHRYVITRDEDLAGIVLYVIHTLDGKKCCPLQNVVNDAT